jgi:hypothetical protein
MQERIQITERRVPTKVRMEKKREFATRGGDLFPTQPVMTNSGILISEVVIVQKVRILWQVLCTRSPCRQ